MGEHSGSSCGRCHETAVTRTKVEAVGRQVGLEAGERLSGPASRKEPAAVGVESLSWPHVPAQGRSLILQVSGRITLSPRIQPRSPAPFADSLRQERSEMVVGCREEKNSAGTSSPLLLGLGPRTEQQTAPRLKTHVSDPVAVSKHCISVPSLGHSLLYPRIVNTQGSISFRCAV